MRTMLMSFNPIWAEKIFSGEKIYEYRSRYCNKKTRVYMYITKPYMEIAGIIELDNRISLEDLERKYYGDKEIIERIMNCRLGNNRYAMPILNVQKTTTVTLEKLREEFPGFYAPQFCYDLDKNRELKTIVY